MHLLFLQLKNRCIAKKLEYIFCCSHVRTALCVGNQDVLKTENFDQMTLVLQLFTASSIKSVKFGLSDLQWISGRR